MLRSMTMLSAIARSEIASHTPAEPNASELRLTGAAAAPHGNPVGSRAHSARGRDAAASERPVAEQSPRRIYGTRGPLGAHCAALIDASALGFAAAERIAREAPRGSPLTLQRFAWISTCSRYAAMIMLRSRNSAHHFIVNEKLIASSGPRTLPAEPLSHPTVCRDAQRSRVQRGSGRVQHAWQRRRRRFPPLLTQATVCVVRLNGALDCAESRRCLFSEERAARSG